MIFKVLPNPNNSMMTWENSSWRFIKGYLVVAQGFSKYFGRIQGNSVFFLEHHE